MNARHPLHKNRDDHRRVEKMGAGNPVPTGSSTSFRPGDHQFRQSSQSTIDADRQQVGIEQAGPAWHSNATSQEGPSYEEQRTRSCERRAQEAESLSCHDAMSESLSHCSQTLPDPLAELITNMIPGDKGEDLAYAFRYAPEPPPITKQSLSELDIGNIVQNIKLRHDVNFDRDLSFRPNLDGSKGQEKLRATQKYWMALEAELALYDRLFRGTPSLATVTGYPEIVEQAQRRIPKMFETIRDVLKSLVPERDHSRVDDHLDVEMLMQEIQRGVCDLVRLAEWLAHLLKEHCAPMRDELVDRMVQRTRSGVLSNESSNIVAGLCELVGILEAMKLDVANHQIRNLKTLLIEDTVNFERHFHLDKVVNGRARVNVESAHQWYESARARFAQLCMPLQWEKMKLPLEVFVRAVVSGLFSNEGHCNFPETFYLDQDRLRALKLEIDDMIYFEISFDMFSELLLNFGYTGPISSTLRLNLSTSLSAIIAQGCQGPSQWMMNSENISLELVRQALSISGSPQNINFEVLQNANRHLRSMFINRFHNQALVLESYLLPQVLSTVTRHIHSSPIELFNNLISNSSAPPQPQAPVSIFPSLHVPANDTLSPHSEQFVDISNRISHMMLIHWRIWGPIAYVVEDEKNTTSTSDAPEEAQKQTRCPPPPSPPQSRPPPPVEANDNPVVSSMKTGDTPDPGEALEYAGSSIQ